MDYGIIGGKNHQDSDTSVRWFVSEGFGRRTSEIIDSVEGATMSVDTTMLPAHPGEVLNEEYLKPLSVSQYRLAVAIGVSPRRINEIVHGQRRISADTALRLARFFGTSERFWMNLQSRYDLETEKDQLAETLAEIQPLRAA